MLSLPFGKGELVVLPGADLAENRRLSLEDNLRFWTNLTLRGPLYFDEYHHRDDGSAKGLARSSPRRSCSSSSAQCWRSRAGGVWVWRDRS